MERNMRSNYVNSGPRSLPHMGSKRHNNGHNLARLSPPAQAPVVPHNNNNNNINSQQDDVINYIYESWNEVSRDLERGNTDATYFTEQPSPRPNFRPFNLEEWWARRLVQSINRNKHRS